MTEANTFDYPGQDVDVTWDRRLCIHIGECGRAQGELFVAGRKPWCQPDAISLAVVVDVVERCPTGALTYQVKDGSISETAAPANTVRVTYNGPLFVRGELDIQGIPKDMPSVKFRAALCRCGRSQQKPFCDNQHESANFRDYGAVGETGTGLESVGGKLTITPLKDGPLLVSGNVAIEASSGREAWTGMTAALCRCGASQNKPFCDGAHVAAGFISEPSA